MITQRISAMSRLRRLLVAWLVCALGVLPLAAYAHLQGAAAEATTMAAMAHCHHTDEVPTASDQQAKAPCCCCDGIFHKTGCKGGCASLHLTSALPPSFPIPLLSPAAQRIVPAVGHLSGLVTEPPFHPPRG